MPSAERAEQHALHAPEGRNGPTEQLVVPDHALDKSPDASGW
jgi:hypothetical protein